MDYLIPILVYLLIGIAASFYFGKRARSYTTIYSYITSGLIVLFWPIGPLAIVTMMLCAFIAIVAYTLGRLVHFMDDEKEGKDETNYKDPEKELPKEPE